VIIAINNKRDNFIIKIIYFFAALYPITPDYFRLFGFPVQFLETILAVFLLFILSGFKYPIIKGKKVNRVFYSTMAWAIAMIAIYLLHGSTYALYSIFIPWIVLFPYLIKYINTKDKFLKVIDILIMCGFIVAVLAIIDEITGINVFWYLNNSGTDIYIHEARIGIARVYSFSSHPNSYSLYCVFIEALIFYRLFCTSLVKKVFYKISYVLVFMAACCTASRSSILLLVLVQVILLWFCGYKRFLRYLFYGLLGIFVMVFIISLIAPGLFDSINRIFILTMAVFSDSYAEQLRALGYQWTTNGVADRFILWNIIFSKMGGHYLFGYGPSTLLEGVKLVNSLGVSNEKTSIEVQFLLVLYRYGIFVAITEEMRNIIQFSVGFKNRKIMGPWENKLGFNKLCFIVFASYFLMLFTLNQTDTVRIYMIMSAMFLSYNYHMSKGVM